MRCFEFDTSSMYVGVLFVPIFCLFLSLIEYVNLFPLFVGLTTRNEAYIKAILNRDKKI